MRTAHSLIETPTTTSSTNLMSKTSQLNLFLCLLLPFFATVSNLNACSCKEVAETFLADFHKEELVIHVQILKHRASLVLNQHASKLKVLNVLNGNLNDDTVYFVNGLSAACLANIEGMAIGEEMILKLEQVYIEKDKTYLLGNTCSRWRQPVKNGRVLGSITKNPMANRHHKMNKLAKKEDAKSLKRLHRLSKKAPKSQSIRIGRLGKMLDRQSSKY